MMEKKIEHIAYQLQMNKKNKQPGAIVFIGAGCSVSAGIPTAKEIVDYVMENYKDNPDIKCFDKKPSYVELMKCLGPLERKKIFKHYVDNAKINVSHIYLAHLLTKGYVDYIVTVNFDNLALRALALYNIFPPIYDISILKDLTTTTLDTKSVTYLHGQHNGLWQLNTKEEIGKVSDSDVVNSILNKITNNRLWIVIGYGGEDYIFDHLVKLGRFDNGLYWIGYKDNEPPKEVQEKLLNKLNKECFWVKGHDSDSFFLKLNAGLKHDDPKIFNMPFSFLSELQENIKDIDDTEDYKPVKERFIESKKMVKDAINKYEKTESSKPPMTNKDIERTKLMKALINCLTSEKYEDLEGLENQIKDRSDKDLMTIVSNIYYNWGTDLGKLARTKSGADAEKLYLQAFEKYSKAIEIKPDYDKAYYNWGTDLGKLADIKSGADAEKLYLQAFEKYSKAIEIKPDDEGAYYNWGTDLGKLADIKSGADAEKLYLQAFEKYSKAIEIKPDDEGAYYNWGTGLGKLADIKSGADAEKLDLHAFEKYSKAIEIKRDYDKAYYNWGTGLGKLADIKSGADAEKLYLQAFEKLNKAMEIKPDDEGAYYNWGTDLGKLADIKSGADAEKLYLQAFEKYSKAIEIKPDYDK